MSQFRQRLMPNQMLYCSDSRQLRTSSSTCRRRRSSCNVSSHSSTLSNIRLHQEQPSPPIEKQVRDLSKDIKGRLQAARVHENIYTLPNILTFSRLIAAPVIGYLVLKEQHAWAVGLFAYAGITDLIDGWIARRWQLQTVVGTVIDPLADKLLMTILTVCLAVQGALPGKPRMPSLEGENGSLICNTVVWLATIILGRDVSLAISAIYYRFASLPPPKTLTRYWDFSLPSAEVHPTGISKANTLLQLLLIGAATAMPIAAPAVEATLQSAGLVDAVGGVHGLMTVAQYLVAGTTVWSGASYLYTRNAVTILNGDPDVRRRILTRGRTILGASFASCLALALALEY